jgi:hypothetical protein
MKDMTYMLWSITKSTFASNFSMADGFWGIESMSDPGTYASQRLEGGAA